MILPLLVTYEEPWIVRANEMHRNAARDEEAERKVIKLTEDIRDLARELRLKVCIYYTKPSYDLPLTKNI